MRSTDYISKGTAVARLYKAREYLLMDKDCRKGLCFYLRSVDILDYLEEIGIWNLDTFSIEVLWAYEDFVGIGPGWLICSGLLCVSMCGVWMWGTP